MNGVAHACLVVGRLRGDHWYEVPWVHGVSQVNRLGGRDKGAERQLIAIVIVIGGVDNDIALVQVRCSSDENVVHGLSGLLEQMALSWPGHVGNHVAEGKPVHPRDLSIAVQTHPGHHSFPTSFGQAGSMRHPHAWVLPEVRTCGQPGDAVGSAVTLAADDERPDLSHGGAVVGGEHCLEAMHVGQGHLTCLDICTVGSTVLLAGDSREDNPIVTQQRAQRREPLCNVLQVELRADSKVSGAYTSSDQVCSSG
jgi:hypothetical protein